jgi:hypothetical protein
MSFIAAAAKTAAPYIKTASPYITAGSAIMGIQQVGAIGKYNQSVANRTADIKTQNNQILDSKLDLDLASFQKQLDQLISAQKVATASSGAVIGSGTANNIRISTLYNAETDKEISKYNTEIAKARNIEEADLSRIRGTLARERAKMEKIKIVSDVGTSLLRMNG